MTNDFKEKLLAFLTGKITQETGDNTPQFESTKTITNNLYTYIANNTTRPNGLGIIRGKNSSGEDLDIYLLYGLDRTDNDGYKGYIVILDKNYMPIQFINKYSSGTDFGKFEILKVGDDGKFFGVESIIENNNERKRFIMLNNILVKSTDEINYQVNIRRAYFLDNSLQSSSHPILDVLKKPGGSNYIFVSSIGLLLVEFKINVGVANEWNVLNNNTGLSVPAETTWASWDNNNNLKLKTLVIANRNAYIIENSNNNLVITKTYNNIISTNDNIYLTNATMLNQNDIYLALYNEKDNTSNYNVYIYKLGNNAELINRTYNTEAYPTGFSNFMYLFNDGRNAYISFNLPQSVGNRFYLGLISGTNVYFDDIGTINEYSSFFIPFISSQFNLYSFFIQNDNTGYLIKTIFNNLNYNGLDYEDINSLVPNSVNLYNENEVVIFSRNLYNRVVNNNTTISTLEIPNDMLNDEIISNELLLSETNTKLVNANEKIETNIYETVDINFYNTINMRNDNNPQNSIMNSIGASRLNNSSSNLKDYDNAKANKLRINYDDGSSSISSIDSSNQIIIDGTIATYKFLVYNPGNKNIVNVEIISQDELTNYQTITLNNLSSNKLYEITQKVEVL